MDLSIDLGVIVQVVLAGSFIWYGRQIREVVTMIKLHDWRLEKLEEQQKLAGYNASNFTGSKCP